MRKETGLKIGFCKTSDSLKLKKIDFVIIKAQHGKNLLFIPNQGIAERIKALNQVNAIKLLKFVQREIG
jgi:hypothetical protein